MIGTRGVPAQYGGFETAVEEIGKRLVQRGHDVTVYCRNEGQRTPMHEGMRLINLPALRKRSVETLSHTGASVMHSLIDRPDAVVLFNAGNAPFLRMLKRRHIPVALHVDGLEWKRAKWQGLGAQYYRHAEAIAARSASPSSPMLRASLTTCARPTTSAATSSPTARRSSTPAPTGSATSISAPTTTTWSWRAWSPRTTST